MDNKTSDKPLLSVLLLSYNHGSYINESIKSIIDSKSEKYQIELLIHDDGSTDETPKIINEAVKSSLIMIHANYDTHKGVSHIARNFNSLISKANGKYITFIASDDVLCGKDYLEKAIESLEENANLDITYCNGVNFKENEKYGMVLNKDITELLSSQNANYLYKYLTSNLAVLYIQGMVAKKEFLESIGGFDDDLIADDWVLNIKSFKRLTETGRQYKYINDIGFLRRIHETNTSKDYDVHYKRIEEVVNRYFKSSDKNRVLADIHWLQANYALQKNKYIKYLYYKLLVTFYRGLLPFLPRDGVQNPHGGVN